MSALAGHYDEDGIDGPWEKAMDKVDQKPTVSAKHKRAPRPFDMRREKNRLSKMIDDHQIRHGCTKEYSEEWCAIADALLSAWSVANRAHEVGLLMDVIRSLSTSEASS